jgi:uncharacterized protein YbjT (DUF2867 family)
MKIKAIVTGATGMVGEGVLHECLLNTEVEEVLIINRKPSAESHPKLKEIVHLDFFDFTSIEGNLSGYNACFFCLGVSSIGMKEAEYNHLTYDLTMHVAKTLLRINPEMVFCYVSGAGTDSTEKGRTMWARVKGKTENHLIGLGFRKTFMFRPAYIQPTKGLKRVQKGYWVLAWAYPVWKSLFPKFVCTLRELGIAMIHTLNKDYEKYILESNDIVRLAND